MREVPLYTFMNILDSDRGFNGWIMSGSPYPSWTTSVVQCQAVKLNVYWCQPSSLVPRPHPLTRRNGVVNQVKFLRLAHAFATM